MVQTGRSAVRRVPERLRTVITPGSAGQRSSASPTGHSLDVMSWLRSRDRNLTGLRRAGRTAIVMPSVFAIAVKMIGNPTVATFAAFGGFAMLLLADFTGSMRERVAAEAGFAVTGAALVCLGTLASRAPWLAGVSMAVVAFCVLFAGVISSVLAAATPGLLLSFILPVSLHAPASSIPDRLEGWGIAAGAAVAAVAFLWPAPAHDPLRTQAAAACRAFAAALRAAVAVYGSQDGASAVRDRDAAVTRADETVVALRRTFLATPYRPTGLGTAARSRIRLVDELTWVDSLILRSCRTSVRDEVPDSVHRLKSTVAVVLDRGGQLLENPRGDATALEAALDDLRQAMDDMADDATTRLPLRPGADAGGTIATEKQVTAVLTSLDPSFRAREIGFAVSQIATNILTAAAAERRSWRDQVLGRQPDGVLSRVAAARLRLYSHLDRHSVWLHNSIRGAVALGAATFVATETGVGHSFWVVLGTLAVLRSNALSTGQNIVRAIAGTAVGFLIGAALIVPLGHESTVLWLLLPVAILVAGVAPAAISFAAGQAAFTVTLVILFNIIAPVGWRIGVLRIEDVAIGCAVSLAVGLVFWPRGASAAFRTALAEAYVDSAAYLADAVEYSVDCCDAVRRGRGLPAQSAVTAGAAARRLDDAYRTFLAERGMKLLPMAEVATLMTGVTTLRLTANALVDLWRHGGPPEVEDRSAVRQELVSEVERVRTWYDDFASGVNRRGPLPEPLPADRASDERLVRAVSDDLRRDDGRATSTAVRVIWTADHLDATRRIQPMLAEAAVIPQG